MSECARPLAAGKKPEDIYPGGEIRLSFWPRAFPRLLQRVTEGDGKFFQAAGAAARQLHVAQAGGIRWLRAGALGVRGGRAWVLPHGDGAQVGAPGTPALMNGPPRDASLRVSRVGGGGVER